MAMGMAMPANHFSIEVIILQVCAFSVFTVFIANLRAISDLCLMVSRDLANHSIKMFSYIFSVLIIF